MTDQIKPPRPSRWKLYALVAALGLAIIGWSVFWNMAAGMAQAGLDDWFAQERALGRQWACAERSVGGYPFRLEVRCASPTFTGRIGAYEGAGSAGDVLAAAHLYNPSLLLAGIGSPFAFKTRDGAFDLNLAWKDLRVSHRIRKGALDRDSLEIEGPVLRVGGRDVPPLTIKADQFEAHLRPNPDRDAAVSAFDVALRLVRLDAPLLDAATGLSGPLDAVLAATVLQVEAARGGGGPQALERWRLAGGNVEIRELKLAKGEARMEASGLFNLDESHRPAGRMDLNLTGFGPLLQRMGFPPLGGQSGALRLPVNLERGRASVGPFRLPVALNPLY